MQSKIDGFSFWERFPEDQLVGSSTATVIVNVSVNEGGSDQVSVDEEAELQRKGKKS